MKKMSMMILLTSVVLTVSAKVHKFNYEFQAVYDAARGRITTNIRSNTGRRRDLSDERCIYQSGN